MNIEIPYLIMSGVLFFWLTMWVSWLIVRHERKGKARVKVFFDDHPRALESKIAQWFDEHPEQGWHNCKLEIATGKAVTGSGHMYAAITYTER